MKVTFKWSHFFKLMHFSFVISISLFAWISTIVSPPTDQAMHAILTPTELVKLNFRQAIIAFTDLGIALGKPIMQTILMHHDPRDNIALNRIKNMISSYDRDSIPTLFFKPDLLHDGYRFGRISKSRYASDLFGEKESVEFPRIINEFRLRIHIFEPHLRSCLDDAVANGDLSVIKLLIEQFGVLPTEATSEISL